jgi:hypothetical protein
MLSLASWKLNRSIRLLLIAKLPMHSTRQVCLNNVEDDHWHVAPPEPVAMLGHVTQAVFLQHILCWMPPHNLHIFRSHLLLMNKTRCHMRCSDLVLHDHILGDRCATCSACLGSPTNLVSFQIYRHKGVSVLVRPMLQNRSLCSAHFFMSSQFQNIGPVW